MVFAKNAQLTVTNVMNGVALNVKMTSNGYLLDGHIDIAKLTQMVLLQLDQERNVTLNGMKHMMENVMNALITV